MIAFHIFNPETDLVLASNSINFTPKKGVEKLRQQLVLLPALYANPEDYIIIPDSDRDTYSNLPMYNVAHAKNIHLATYSNLHSILGSPFPESLNIRISPWGWNKEIINRLASNGIPSRLLPSVSSIESLKELSHRRLTIDFFAEFIHYIPNIASPEIFYNIKDVEAFINSHSDYCFKAPWSSSGRGIVFSDKMPKDKILEWAGSIIKNQQSVMAEPKYSRSLDFASEWYVENKQISFLGYSLFQSSSRGKYKGNFLYSQEKIKKIITSSCVWDDRLLDMQHDFILHRIAPSYNGPIGFDMLADSTGIVNPCVEINLRMTMGHLAIELTRQLHDLQNPTLANILSSYFPNHIFFPSLLLN